MHGDRGGTVVGVVTGRYSCRRGDRGGKVVGMVTGEVQL